MKKFFNRFVALALALVMMGGMIVPASAADYTCSDYAVCTADGAEIYIITKNNCPIREEPHNEGKIVGRGQVGQLLSVNRVFWTVKMARWAELNVYGSDEKLYIHIDNCEPHIKHDYINALTTNKGFVDFCAICGVAQAFAEGESASCDLTCISDQAVKGSFSNYNTSFASVVAQMIVGEIPGIGTIADARDVVGDIMTGQPAHVIAADCMALLPLLGMLKYTDDLSTVAKNADDLPLLAKKFDDLASVAKKSDDLASTAKKVEYIPWGKWSDYNKAVVNGEEVAEIGDFYYKRHAVDEFLNPSIQTNLQRSKNGGLVEHSRGVPPSYINWVLTEGLKNGTTIAGKPYVKNGLERIKYSNGSLDVVVEAGNVIVTIITK